MKRTSILRTISDNGKEIVFARVCPFCGKEHEMAFDSNAYFAGAEKYNAGTLVQNAFSSFTPSQREFLLTGICDECWNGM